MMDRGKLSRRAFLGFAAIAGTGVIAACKPTATPVPTQAPTKAATAAPAATKAPTVAPPTAVPEKVELRFIKLGMRDSVAKYFNDSAIPNFQKANANITVKIDMSDWDHLGEKMLTSFAGNLPIDLVETGSDWVGPYAQRKQFLPIDDYINKDYQDEIGDFYKEMVDISRFKGSLLGMPYILDIRTMCYRKDDFQEVGLDPAKPPQTWDDLVEYAGKLVKKDAQGNITRAGYMMDLSGTQGSFFEFWYLLVQNGSDIVVPWGSWDIADVKFNGPEGVEALQFLTDLINKYKICPMTGMSHKNPDLTVLAEGVTSMTTQSSWEIGVWKEYQPGKLPQLGVGVPLMKKKRLQYVCPNIYAIGTNTRHSPEAWKLMKFMISKDVVTNMLSAESSAPPRKSVAAEAAYMKDPLLQAYQQVAEKGWGTTTPQATDWPTLEIVGNYVQAVVRGEMKVQEGLDKAAAEVKKKITSALAAQ